MAITREEARQEAHEQRYNPCYGQRPQCCVCRTTKGEVMPCANIDCRNEICTECQIEGSIAAALGVCDDEGCAVVAIKDLRSMLASRRMVA